MAETNGTRFAGKVAIVTGGALGIGGGTARRLAADGASVLIADIADDAAQANVGRITAAGGNAIAVHADMAISDDIQRMVETAVSEFGRLDILIANASGFGLTLDEAGWRQGFDVDILGTFHAVEAATPLMEASGGGAIVSISSIAGVEAFGGVRPYSAVKAALITYIGNLANALAPKNIRANTVSPGTIYFEGGVWQQREREAPDVFKTAFDANPMGRMGTAEEVANAAVFLASPAASFITGTNIIVDGALTRRVQF